MSDSGQLLLGKKREDLILLLVFRFSPLRLLVLAVVEDIRGYDFPALDHACDDCGRGLGPGYLPGQRLCRLDR